MSLHLLNYMKITLRRDGTLHNTILMSFDLPEAVDFISAFICELCITIEADNLYAKPQSEFSYTNSKGDVESDLSLSFYFKANPTKKGA